jgi:FtsP/CotA-like multicopper oxidase with cupredoxin domain
MTFQSTFPARRRRRDHRGRLDELGQQGGDGRFARTGVPGQAGHHAAAGSRNGRPYNPVVTLNGWTLPWRMNKGVKEFHLVAEPVVREMAPGFKAHLWGYNGQSPGPTIEVVEGDRVRIYVTNKLPSTSIHWHGQRLPNGMDGVAGLNQPAIPPARPSSTSSSRAGPAPSCTTRMPTRWCRWRWA